MHGIKAGVLTEVDNNNYSFEYDKGYLDQTFMEFGKRIGLNDKILSKELNRFAAEYPTAEKMIKGCGLPDDLTQNYLLSYKYRCYTLR